MTVVAPGIKLIDLEYRGKAEVLASCLVNGSGGGILIDPGPSTTLAVLRRSLDELGIGLRGIRTILLTHIHLDHAGAAGTLVAENPAIEVWVHAKGAQHLVDPTRLRESARQVYGAELERRWGDIAAVPAANLHPLTGGERLGFGDRHFAVAYTPGHASHHVSFLEESSGTAFVGDTGGNRYSNRPFVSPVTPPPDVDLDGWDGSIATIRAWRAARLFSTHFGCSEPVDPHLDELHERLHHWSRRVRASLAAPIGDDRAQAEEFAAWVAGQLRERMDEADASAYEWGTTALNSWHGLARYWRHH